MKIMLVQVPTSHMGAGEKVYPLGLSRLSSTIPSRHEKWALDMNLPPDPWPELKQMLMQHGPDVVALSFRNLDPLAGHQTSYLSSLKTAALLTRKLLPEARIIAGGPAFSLFANRLMMEVPQIDIGLKGEGERIFHRLLENAYPLDRIPGILFRRNGSKQNGRNAHGEHDKSDRHDENHAGHSGQEEIIVNPSPEPVPMNELPPLDVETFNPNDYTKQNAYVAPIGIEGKRGCDLWCGYCLYPMLGGNCMRLRPPVMMVDEMEMLHNAYGISLFHLTDAVVNRPTGHFEIFCKEMIRRKLNDKVMWTGFFREESFDPKNLALAKRAGMACIYFSADALTEYGLKLLNKRMSCDDILEACRMTAKENILTMCHFLINLPGETDAHVRETREMLHRLLDIHAPAGNLGAVIFNHIRLYPNAPVTRHLIRSGELSPETDLLYPVYYNPEHRSHLLHELEAECHALGILSRLEMN